MPGSDDQYDQVHTYSQDHAGKSKTTKPAVRELGRDGAPTRLYVGEARDSGTIRTPPSGVVYLFIDSADNQLKQKDPSGTVTSLVGAPADASYVTINSESTLSNETLLSADGNALGDITVQDALLDEEWYVKALGGTVAAGDAGPVWTTTLADGETLNVTQAGLILDDATAAPNGLDLIIADLTNNVSEVTLINGDGTLKDDVTGSPIGSYTNSSGGTEQVGILMDNGNFNAGTGSNQDAIGSFTGRVV